MKNCKYGVIEKEEFVKDAEEWKTLYISGRLHKPVKWLKMEKDLEDSIERNLNSALKVSLILLCSEMPIPQQILFEKISSISYKGDIRTGIAENPNKIKNIVEPNLDHFQLLYENPLHQLEQQEIISIKQNHIYINPSNHALLFEDLPKSLFGILKPKKIDPHIQFELDNKLSQIVKKSSFKQTVKGIPTAGITKSFFYALRKVKKIF